MLPYDVLTLQPYFFDRMTDEEFYEFCRVNKGLRIERNKDHEITIMSPTGSKTSALNAIINRLLGNWNENEKAGVVFDSSGGFKLKDTSILSPDASWVSLKNWGAITSKEQEKLAPVCPEFVIELRSPNDSLAYMQRKMSTWIKNGTQLAWLIDPKSETVQIFRSNGNTETVAGFDHMLSGENVLPGFKLDLKQLRI